MKKNNNEKRLTLEYVSLFFLKPLLEIAILILPLYFLYQWLLASQVSCFCDDHKRVAEQSGINFARAKEGFMKLDQFVQATPRSKIR
ncbi:MAG: hypothetical protein ABI687_11260 [Flavitalea sp.]